MTHGPVAHHWLCRVSKVGIAKETVLCTFANIHMHIPEILPFFLNCRRRVIPPATAATAATNRIAGRSRLLRISLAECDILNCTHCICLKPILPSPKGAFVSPLPPLVPVRPPPPPPPAAARGRALDRRPPSASGRPGQAPDEGKNKLLRCDLCGH